MPKRDQQAFTREQWPEIRELSKQDLDRDIERARAMLAKLGELDATVAMYLIFADEHPDIVATRAAVALIRLAQLPEEAADV